VVKALRWQTPTTFSGVVIHLQICGREKGRGGAGSVVRKRAITGKAVEPLQSLQELLEINHIIIASQNHRMVWVGKDLKDHLVPTPLPGAGTSSTRPGCSEFHPTWP